MPGLGGSRFASFGGWEYTKACCFLTRYAEFPPRYKHQTMGITFISGNQKVNIILMFTAGFGSEVLTFAGDESSEDSKSFLQGYKSVLDSKANEESLVSTN